MVLSNLKPKKITILAFFIRKKVKNSKIGGFGCKKSSNFEENSMIYTYSLVPKIDHPVALCAGEFCLGEFGLDFGHILGQIIVFMVLVKKIRPTC